MSQQEETIFASSLIGAETQKGLVALEWAGKRITMSPEDAITLAQNILAAAEASKSDEFLYHFGKGVIGLDHGRALSLLRQFRQFREHLIDKTPNPNEI